MNNGTTEFITSDVAAQAFYASLDKQISWASFRLIRDRYIEGVN